MIFGLRQTLPADASFSVADGRGLPGFQQVASSPYSASAWRQVFPVGNRSPRHARACGLILTIAETILSATLQSALRNGVLDALIALRATSQ